ncbi:TPA: DUF551 domain-containing protein [Escherichia coli]|jgi:hypothetical protein|nr:DUF551 domain-containing protein [Escherichia coli]HBA4672177.1 DUF551 domain-containing protein [Escherichia coli]HBA4691611.1 DUF551 domain-containing protein [Escherichia coli]HBA4710748.1 DUF551 domain-containing protein [Escherichia coli]HBA5088877.1 DUF551 domain-containing protein [Escherichia coli]
MITITKGRLLTIKQWRETYGPGSNVVLPAEEAEELARIALASLEADPVKRVNSDQMHRVCLEANRYLDKYDAMAKEVNKLLGRIAPPAPVLPHEWRLSNAQAFIERYSPPSVEEAALFAWNACRAAMLQSGNFRENKNSSTNNFREIAETSTNYPAIPSEVLSAILKVARIRADFDDFDGDRRGIGDCLDEAEQELIVTINKYASQLAAEPIAPNDVREQTAIPQVPVTPDGWISCSERMPAQDDWILIYSKHGEYMAGQVQGEYVELSDGTLSWLGNALYWMPLPEPPQEVK